MFYNVRGLWQNSTHGGKIQVSHSEWYHYSLNFSLGMEQIFPFVMINICHIGYWIMVHCISWSFLNMRTALHGYQTRTQYILLFVYMLSCEHFQRVFKNHVLGMFSLPSYQKAANRFVLHNQAVVISVNWVLIGISLTYDIFNFT